MPGDHPRHQGEPARKLNQPCSTKPTKPEEAPMFTPLIGNITAILVLVTGCAFLFAIEKLMDRRNRDKYLPRPNHRGATKRVITARRSP